MRRFTAFLMVFVTIMTATAQTNETSNNTEVNEDAQTRLKEIALYKAVKRDATERSREYESQGFEVMSSKSMKDAMTDYYTRLYKLEDNGLELCGTSFASTSKALGRNQAIQNAIMSYALMTVKNLIREVNNDAGDEEINSEQLDKFSDAFGEILEKELQQSFTSKGPISEGCTLYKQLDNGNYAVQSFLIADESKTGPTIEKALNKALNEIPLPEEYVAKLRDGIHFGPQ